MATFYVARSEIITPLPWLTFALPFSAFVRRRRPLGPSITSSRETPTLLEPSKWTPILPSLSKIQHLRHAHACRMAGSDQKWQEGVGVALTQHQLIVRAAAATFALPKQPEVE